MELSTQNPFLVLPTALEKETRTRKNSLEKAFLYPSEVVFEISHHYFIPSVAKSLQNQSTCIMQLQTSVMNSPHSLNLSDFVAICVIYVYNNIKKEKTGNKISQTQTQAVAFLKNVMEKKYQNFDFGPDEQDFIISSIISNPPIYKSDYNVCVSIIEFYCRAEDKFCLGRFIERLKLPDISEESKKFLMKCSNAIVEFNQQISTNEKDFLTSFSNQKISEESETVEIRDFEPTPTKEKIDKLILNNRFENVSNIFKPYKLIYFIVATIVIFIIALLF